MCKIIEQWVQHRSLSLRWLNSVYRWPRPRPLIYRRNYFTRNWTELELWTWLWGQSHFIPVTGGFRGPLSFSRWALHEQNIKPPITWLRSSNCAHVEPHPLILGRTSRSTLHPTDWHLNLQCQSFDEECPWIFSLVRRYHFFLKHNCIVIIIFEEITTQHWDLTMG